MDMTPYTPKQKALADGSRSATPSPKLPEPCKRQTTSSSTDVAGRSHNATSGPLTVLEQPPISTLCRDLPCFKYRDAYKLQELNLELVEFQFSSVGAS